MSAECHIHGCDLVGHEFSEGGLRCPECDLRARGDRYLKALHEVAWRLHLVLGDEFNEPEIETILDHLDAGLPFGAPE